MIPFFLTCFCFTAFFVSHQAQAQMQSKTITNTSSNSSQNANPQLFVTPKKAEPSTEQKEIDRVFEKYKLLSAQQDAKRNAKPMKNNPAKPKKPDRPTISQKQQKPQQASGGGFAAILDSYERAKQGRSTVQSKSVTTPDEITIND